ncbi:MAG: YdcH family protein, partial [Proteobacteria bacterium]|nr:YdcH family protein [Pseudomonadota bacterium]
MTDITVENRGPASKSTEPRISSLKKRHASLETALDHEACRPMPDTGTIAHLKREKLAIKDELQRLAPR